MKISELFDVSGKVAVVTGGSRGIGEMISAGFLANGVKVYMGSLGGLTDPIVWINETLSSFNNFSICLKNFL